MTIHEQSLECPLQTLHRGVGRNSFILQDIGVGTRNRRIKEYVLFFCWFFFWCGFLNKDRHDLGMENWDTKSGA